MTEYNLYLRICGKKDKDLLELAAQYLRTYPLWTDSKARVIDHAEYARLVEAGEVKKPSSYWAIDEGEYGVVHDREYNKYGSTWEKVLASFSGFRAGYGMGRLQGSK